MNASDIKIPLNNSQLEILKLFSRELEERDLLEIKRLIVSYLGEKVSQQADQAWDANNWTDEDMKKLLNTHQRTPFPELR